MSYGVILGTGLTVKGEGICRGVELQLPGLIVMEDFLPLESGRSDITLGLQWLDFRCHIHQLEDQGDEVQCWRNSGGITRGS